MPSWAVADLFVQSAFIDRVLAFVGLMQQGRATFPSMPGMLILSSWLTVAQPATTSSFTAQPLPLE